MTDWVDKSHWPGPDEDAVAEVSVFINGICVDQWITEPLEANVEAYGGPLVIKVTLSPLTPYEFTRTQGAMLIFRSDGDQIRHCVIRSNSHTTEKHQYWLRLL